MVKITSQNNRQLLKNTQLFLNQIPLPTRIHHWLQTRSFQRAVNRAYCQFAQQHHQWVGSYFDDHFIKQHTPRLLEYYRQNNRLTVSSELAHLWADQFPPNSVLRKHIEEARVIAGIFLALVEVEL